MTDFPGPAVGGLVEIVVRVQTDGLLVDFYAGEHRGRRARRVRYLFVHRIRLKRDITTWWVAVLHRSDANRPE